MADNGFDKMAQQMRRHLADLEPRSNASTWNASSPAAKTSGYAVAEIPDWQLRQWLHIAENASAKVPA